MKTSFWRRVPTSSSLHHDNNKKSAITISFIKFHMTFRKISVAKMTYGEITQNGKVGYQFLNTNTNFPIKSWFTPIKGWCIIIATIITIIINIISNLSFTFFTIVILPRRILQVCVRILLFLSSLGIYLVNSCIVIWELSLLT